MNLRSFSTSSISPGTKFSISACLTSSSQCLSLVITSGLFICTSTTSIFGPYVAADVFVVLAYTASPSISVNSAPLLAISCTLCLPEPVKNNPFIGFPVLAPRTVIVPSRSLFSASSITSSKYNRSFCCPSLRTA